MNVSLSSELQHFINEEVKAGRYTSPQEVVEEALSRLMEVGADPDEEIDDDTLAALQRSEDQIRRGEGMTISEVREHFRQRGVELGPTRPSSGGR